MSFEQTFAILILFSLLTDSDKQHQTLNNMAEENEVKKGVLEFGDLYRDKYLALDAKLKHILVSPDTVDDLLKSIKDVIGIELSKEASMADIQETTKISLLGYLECAKHGIAHDNVRASPLWTDEMAQFALLSLLVTPAEVKKMIIETTSVRALVNAADFQAFAFFRILADDFTIN